MNHVVSKEGYMLTFFVLAIVGLLALFGLSYVVMSWLMASPRSDSHRDKGVSDLTPT